VLPVNAAGPGEEQPIFHLALARDWAAARAGGWYRISTLGVTVEEAGFVHASFADQLAEVGTRFYAEVSEPLVLLTIDRGLVSAPVVEEPAVPGADVLFPHVYGPLNVDAVIAVRPVARDAAGRLELP
jgi:uncharacterized protein (DUF952 family)